MAALQSEHALTGPAGRKEVDWTTAVEPRVRVRDARVWLVLVTLAMTIVPAVTSRIAAPDVPPRLVITRECLSGIGAALGSPVDGAGPLMAAVTRNRAALSAMNACEDRVDEQAPWRALIGPTVQLVLTRLMATGNEQVVVGRDGWLFYRSALDHVTGLGFLDDRWHAARLASAESWTSAPHSDPRPAITGFARGLARRGIHLVVLPVPGKATVHPARLSRRAVDSTELPRNASFHALVRALRDAGVDVLDIAPLLADQARRANRAMDPADGHALDA